MCRLAISACEKGGEWQLALALPAAMLQDVIEPDVITYSTAVSAAAGVASGADNSLVDPPSGYMLGTTFGAQIYASLGTR